MYVKDRKYTFDTFLGFCRFHFGFLKDYSLESKLRFYRGLGLIVMISVITPSLGHVKPYK